MFITAALVAGQLMAAYPSISSHETQTDGLLVHRPALEQMVGIPSEKRVGIRMAQYCMPPQPDSDVNIFCHQ